MYREVSLKLVQTLKKEGLESLYGIPFGIPTKFTEILKTVFKSLFIYD